MNVRLYATGYWEWEDEPASSKYDEYKIVSIPPRVDDVCDYLDRITTHDQAEFCRVMQAFGSTT